MRPMITYEHVAAAAEALERQGVKPTIERVRGQLREQGLGQGGSATTVSAHLAHWRGNRPGAGAAAVPLSDPLLRATQAVHEEVRRELQVAFDAKVQHLQADAEQRIQDAEHESLAARAALALARERESLLNQRADSLEARAEAGAREAAATQARLEQAGQAVVEVRGQLSAALEKANVEMAMARHTVELLTAEGAQHREAATRWQEQVTQTRAQVTDLQAAARETEARQGAERQQLTRRLDTLVDSLQAAQSREAEALREVGIVGERAAALARKGAELEAAWNAARQSEARWQNEVLRLTRLLEPLQKEIAELRAAQDAQATAAEQLADHLRRLETLLQPTP